MVRPRRETGVGSGTGFEIVWPQLAAIVGLGIVFFVVALLRFRASLAAQS